MEGCILDKGDSEGLKFFYVRAGVFLHLPRIPIVIGNKGSNLPAGRQGNTKH